MYRDILLHLWVHCVSNWWLGSETGICWQWSSKHHHLKNMCRTLRVYLLAAFPLDQVMLSYRVHSNWEASALRDDKKNCGSHPGYGHACCWIRLMYRHCSYPVGLLKSYLSDPINFKSGHPLWWRLLVENHQLAVLFLADVWFGHMARPYSLWCVNVDFWGWWTDVMLVLQKELDSQRLLGVFMLLPLR